MTFRHWTPLVGFAGIDHSPAMHEMAARRCATFIEGGRLELRVGDNRALPYPDSSFDKVLAGRHRIQERPRPY